MCEKTVICAFCRQIYDCTDTKEISINENGPERLVGRKYCSYSCRANDILLSHLDIRIKYPQTSMSYEALLGMTHLND